MDSPNEVFEEVTGEEMAQSRQQPDRKRKQSIMYVPGKEGKFVAKGTYEGKAIGVFTSGGDAQGKWSLVIYPPGVLGSLLLSLKGKTPFLPTSGFIAVSDVMTGQWCLEPDWVYKFIA